MGMALDASVHATTASRPPVHQRERECNTATRASKCYRPRNTRTVEVSWPRIRRCELFLGRWRFLGRGLSKHQTRRSLLASLALLGSLARLASLAAVLGSRPHLQYFFVVLGRKRSIGCARFHALHDFSSVIKCSLVYKLMPRSLRKWRCPRASRNLSWSSFS